MNRDRKKNKKTTKSLLEEIRPKLRRFQVEALEFATTGKAYRHLKNNESNNDCKVLGNGRVLLADGTYRAVQTYDFPRRRNTRLEHIDGLTFALAILSEMGLGKTVTALAIASYYEHTDWPVLIMCPASLRYTWPSEIEKFWPTTLPPSEVHIVNGFSDVAWMDRVRNGKVRIVVLTYSLLQQRSTVAQSLLEQVEAHASQQKKTQHNKHGQRPVYFPTIICDESHNLKQRDSQRFKMAQPLLAASSRLLLLSGTPALARPVELWTQLQALSPELFGSFKSYADRYCDPKKTWIYSRGGRRFPKIDYNGASMMDDLHTKLARVMVRRLKADVLDELPPKSRALVYIDITKDQASACRQAMKEVKDSREMASFMNAHSSFENKSALMKAYQATGIGKAAAVADYLLDWLEGSANTEKIVVFAHHKKVLDLIHEALLRHGSKKGGKAPAPFTHIRIDGQVNSSVRHQLVRQFQTQPNTRVALLSITAAGVGLTMTAASTVLFAELHWTPGVLAQGEDRVHRIGASATKVSQMLYCICRNDNHSLDPLLCQIIGKKMHTLSRVVDGMADDGKKRAFLAGAEDAPSTLPTHQSGQDELTDFFAQNLSPSIHAKNSPRPRGSIENFFARAKETSPESAKKPPPSQCCTSAGDGKKDYAVAKKESSFVAWSCNACTYENKKPGNFTGLYTCDMCDETYSRTAFVTPNTKTKKSKPEVIHLDLADDTDECSEGDSKPEVIHLDSADECGESDDTVVILDSPPPAKKRKKTIEPLWQYSVSKNSNRLTVHRRERVLCNFDLSDVLSPETTNDLLARQSRNTAGQLSISFSLDGLKALVAKVRESSHEVLIESEATQLLHDTKSFISNYIRLREVEKKALKESCRAFAPTGLSHSVAKLLHMTDCSNTQQTTERYEGGAKERALKRRDNGELLNAQDLQVLRREGCAWCGKKLPIAHQKAKAVYCDQTCAEEGRLKRGGRAASQNIRSAMFALEGGRCTICNVDAHSLYEQILALQPSERLNKLLQAKWRLPRSASAVKKLLQNPKEGDFWQVDHKQAVALGGGSCGLENLRTLCVPCHQTETEKLQPLLKLREQSQTHNGTTNTDCMKSRKQTDIRSSFFAATKK